jgi:photosystem II stability/assembly factor-like uncharacterized protein
MKISLSALILALACAGSQAAWKPAGPYGGEIWHVNIFGSDLFASGFGGALWRSSDRGATWTFSRFQNAPFAMMASGANLYASGSDGVFLSGDRGTTWKSLTANAPKADSLDLHQCGPILAFGRFLIVETAYALYRSRDGGTSWNRVFGGGDTLGNGIPFEYSLAQEGGYVYAASQAGLYRSADSGAAGSWRVVAKGADGSLGQVTTLGRYVFVSGGSVTGLLRSADHGITWDTLSREQDPNQPSGSIKAQGRALYGWSFGDSPAGPALFRSLDSGGTWTRTGLEAGLLIEDLADQGDTLYAADWRSGVLRSLDGGRHFDTCALRASNFSFLGAIGDRLLALVGNPAYHSPGMDIPWGGFISTDPGEIWTPMADLWPSMEGWMAHLTYLSQQGDLGFAVAGDERNYLTRDGGLTWAEMPRFPYPPCDCDAGLEAVAIHQGAIFEVRHDAIYRSTDGTSWSKVRLNNWAMGRPFRTLLSVGQDLFHSDSLGVSRTSDGGNTWTDLKAAPAGVRVMAAAPNAVYAAGRLGVFRTADKGVTWTRVNRIRTGFFLMTAAGTSLLAADDSLGLFLSSDAGATWSAINEGLPSPARVTALLVAGSAVYINSAYAGLWRRPLGELVPVGTLPRPDPESGHAGLHWVKQGDRQGIAFFLDRPGPVRLEAFAPSGRRLALLADGPMSAGSHSAWFGNRPPRGPCLLRMRSNGSLSSRILRPEN